MTEKEEKFDSWMDGRKMGDEGAWGIENAAGEEGQTVTG